ncbi:MAG: DMT family transporter [Labrys sp. (in: a-proteobacteria)]
MTMLAAQPVADRTPLLAYLAIATTILSWASAFVAIRYCLETIPPVELAAARYGLAAVPAALWLVMSRASLPSWRDAVRLFVIGLLFVAVYAVLLNLGELTVPAGPAAFIVNTMPIFVALIAAAAFAERIGLGGWAGMMTSFGGIGLIAVSTGAGIRIDAGALMILGAAMCAAIASILQKPILARMPALTVTAWTLFFGALPFLAVAPSTIRSLTAAPAPALWATLYLAVVPTVIGYVTWAVALRALPASRAANFLYCVPPTALTLGFLLLGEAPTALGLVGCVVTIGGVVLFNALRRR